ncbi:IS607 family transposase [Aetokthonos hydrillicola]|nr:IS607 family transposase [Aetokthonos hydrillicola]
MLSFGFSKAIISIDFARIGMINFCYEYRQIFPRIDKYCYTVNMKLSQYAEHIGVSYKTAWRWWKAGKLPHPAKQSLSGTVLVDFTPQSITENNNSIKVAIYARVSSSENKSNLDRQADRLTQYSVAKGYTIIKIVKEIGSGLNDNRKKLNSLLESDDYDVLLVEHKDRLALVWNWLYLYSFETTECQTRNC